MNYQLELFQPENDYEKKIFLRAKLLKNLISGLYSKIDKIMQIDSPGEENFATLKFVVKIDQISDDEIVEPNTPKMFIWKFIPSIIFIKDGKPEIILNEGDTIDANICPKIIPKWANEYFTNSIFTHSMFLEFVTQYFTLELVTHFLKHDLFKGIQGAIADRKLIFYLDCKLFPSVGIKSESVPELEILNRIKNLFTKLKNSQRESWYFVGQYENFTKDKDLLLDLEKNDRFLELKKAEIKLADVESLYHIFNNDYLFLNNSEFFSNSKFNTQSWANNYVLCPAILNTEFSSIDEKLLHKTLNDTDIGRNLYIYRKKGAGESFFRADVLLPDKDTTVNQVISLFRFIEELKDDTR